MPLCPDYGCSRGLILAAGLAGFAGSVGLGTAVLRQLRVRVPTPFREVTATVLGIQIYSLAVQIAGMAGRASARVLICAWAALTLIGFAGLVLFRKKQQDASGGRGPILATAIIIVAAAVNLAAALAPSSKADEVFYHMLVPHRIVADHGLRFYRVPYEAAIAPQMVFQIAAAPFHAMTLIDAPNIISWALSLMLVWFSFTLLRRDERRPGLTFFWAAAVIVGAYSTVFDVTGGSHAYGELGAAVAVVALGMSEHLLAEVSPGAFAAMMSVLAWGTASAKITMLPVSLAMLTVTVVAIRRATGGITKKTMLALTLPFIIMALPIMAWTFVASGSPFAWIMSGWLKRSVYDQANVQQFVEQTRYFNRGSLLAALREIAMAYSPLLFAGALAVFFVRQIPRQLRMWLGVIFAGQLVVLLLWMPYQARFLGGLPYGLLILFLVFVPASVLRTAAVRTTVGVVTACCLLPWLGVQAYYGKQFVRVASGLERPANFMQRYIACYSDFRQLDRQLPRDAVLLVDAQRLAAVYSPRPMYFDSADLPHDHEVYLVTSSPLTEMTVPLGFVVRDESYFNPSATMYTSRRPGVPNTVQPLHVVRLERVTSAMRNPRQADSRSTKH